MAGLVNSATTKYNGQDVLTDDATKASIVAGAKMSGQDPMSYDKSLNPTTYGARWNVPDPNPTATANMGKSAEQQLQESKAYYSGAGTPSTIGTGYTSTDWNVGKDQTVEGRLANLTDPNSALNQQAAAQALQTSNSRGLINSSLAVTAGQDAVLKNALPIAQQDASTFATAGQTNAAAKNTSSQFNAAATNQASLANQSVESQKQLAQAQNASQEKISQLSSDTQKFLGELTANTNLATTKLSADTQLSLGTLDAKTKTDLQNIVSKNSQLLQANTSAANATSQLMASIAQVQANDKLDAEAKQTAVNNLINVMNESLRTFNDISGAGLDLSKYFQQQGIVPATTTPAPVVPDEAVQ